MTAHTGLKFLLVLPMALLLGAGCDWEHYALMNSIPAEGYPERNPEVRVYLGIDGLTPSAVERARERGAFSSEEWKLSRFVSMFPATSDASWTRIMRAPPIDGYEYGFYDPTQDRLINEGVGGLLAHVLPHFEGSPIPTPEHARAPGYYRGFDYHASAYFEAAVSYGFPILGYHQSLDALFSVLGGRSETAPRFSGYILQTDVIAHELGDEAMISTIVALSDKIDDFRKAHPERRFYFTLFSDHGVDFVQKPEWGVIDFREELRSVGVFPAKSFAEGRGQPGPFAVPVLHTRVTYLALHAPPQHVDEVAKRASTLGSVDLILTRANVPADAPAGTTSWHTLWAGGAPVLVFGYEPGTDMYWVPRGFDQARLGLELPAPAIDTGDGNWVAYDDTTLFLATRDRTYPDLFFRARTGLEAIGVRYPAQLLVSLRHPYVSTGFALPGTDDVGTAGSHGSMEKGGSLGTLLTNERELPPYVRSDQMLGLFPELEEHVRRQGVQLRSETQGAELELESIR